MKTGNNSSRIAQLIQKTDQSILVESDLNQTYVSLRKHKDTSRQSLYKQKEPFRNILTNILNNSNAPTVLETTTSHKKKMFLDELKQSLIQQKQNNEILKGQWPTMALYLKNSELLVNSCDQRLHGQVVDMEVPLLKLLLRVCRNLQAIKDESDLLRSQIVDMKSHNEEMLEQRKYEQKSKQKKEPQKKQTFLKFKKQQQNRSMSHFLELSKKEQAWRQEKEGLLNDIRQLKQSFDRYEADKLKMLQAIDYRSMQIKSLTISNSKLQQKNRQLQEQINQLKNESNQLNQEMDKWKEMHRYRELWFMASQDSREQIALRSEEHVEILKLAKKYRILKERLNGLLENKTVEISEDCGKEKDDLRHIIDQINIWPGFNRIALSSMNQPQSEKQMMIEEPQNALGKILDVVRPGMPHFYVFLEFHDQLISYELKHIKTKNLERTFFLKMRAIMDSKWSEFWANQSQWKRFPDFVIGFLQKFDLCPSYKKIKVSTQPQDVIESSKVSFFLDLYNPKLKDVWQCVIFRDFLVEHYHQDDLYFYLSCRNLIFNGAVLENLLISSDPILYITIEKAVKIVELVLSQYERSVLEKIKFGLQVKKKRKNNRYYIDSHFLLKVLLDIYLAEKQRRLQFYEMALVPLESRARSGPGKCISYNNFRKFMTANYSFMPFADLASLYRECYCYSRGEVTYKVIFALASETIFVRQLKSNPILATFKGCNLKNLTQSVINLSRNLEDCQYNNKFVLQLGVQQYCSKLENFKKLVDISLQSQLTPQIIISAVESLEVTCRIFILELLKRNDGTIIEHLLQEHLVQVVRMASTAVEFLNDIAKLKQQNNIAIKMAAHKLAGCFKKKIQAIYRSFDEKINRKLLELKR